ncbi:MULTISPECIES: NAD(P)-dependent oxidoreductase [unclassified Haloarcula]|uniref:NAD-dependent epimerase/dehydratase family protein n=1 Tax=unclassified Haloarcula TaxID=2624677 RepID=UPI000EF270B6|nr:MULTISPECIES: NAD(P)-dependent oxidoreductase [unclassified Haloarcula]RLM36637.1 NAD(P)-dependent oxidoreductase [Haloarcula sp. Atlit-120R]RLM44976.1 NAD(P)-dependent oxidoreductase [Haloarcula sp. Atlit-47R]
MDVVVTGGRGSSGRWVVDRLAEPHDVTVLDRRLPDGGGHPEVDYRALDLTDAGSVFDSLTAIDPDAVVHWAAIPVAGTHPGVDLFRNNALAAHTVLSAAGRVGADVVQGSSDGAYGFFFAEETPVPDELPITEAHARRPEDDYGLSKVVTEEIGKAIARRDGVSVASIRPSWIQIPGEYPCRAPEYVDDLAAGAGNYWSYVDVRDVVDLVEAALAGAVEGHEAFNCVGPDNALGRPLVELMREHYGRVPDDCTVEGDAAAYATAKATAMLGWEPTRSWREAADEDVDVPTV